MARGERVIVPGSERGAPADAVDRGAADPAEPLEITVVVRPRAVSRRPDLLDDTPPSQRRYLTREELAARSGAAPEDLEAVAAFAREHRLRVVARDPARRCVILAGTAGTVAAAFETSLRRYEREGKTFRGRSGPLKIPAELHGIVTAVLGIDDRPQARTQFRVRPAHAQVVSYTAPQIGALYEFPSGVDGRGETIALIELGGGYAAADLQAYFAKLGITAPSITSVALDGAANAPTGDPEGPDGEVLLDIEVAGALAPGAAIVVYFAPNTDRGFLDAVTTAIHDTQHAPTILSISWGGPEGTWTRQARRAFDLAFADAAQLGMTVCVASGDSGSSDGVGDGAPHVDFPASSPHVLACGGTSLHARGTAIARETVWNDPGDGATGGGVSVAFPLPSWQRAANVPAAPNGKPGRGVPDVAGDADPATGYTVRVDGRDGVLGGTSAVAPLWAALVARLNESLGVRVGFVNPRLYANPGALRDVTSGSNGAYAAHAGWDPCTGLGSPRGTRLRDVFR